VSGVEGSQVRSPNHPGGNPRENLKSISRRSYFREVALEWELTKETIYLPLGCLQGGLPPPLHQPMHTIPV
jgi:hypothetical protein